MPPSHSNQTIMWLGNSIRGSNWLPVDTNSYIWKQKLWFPEDFPLKKKKTTHEIHDDIPLSSYYSHTTPIRNHHFYGKLGFPTSLEPLEPLEPVPKLCSLMIFPARTSHFTSTTDDFTSVVWFKNQTRKK